MRSNLRILAATATALICSAPVFADDIDGWCAEYICDAQQGIHKLVIRKDNDKVKIHVYATGLPSDVDWGEADAEVYHSQPGSLPSFIAHYLQPNTETMIVIVPNTGGNPSKPGGIVQVSSYVKSAKGAPQIWTSCNFKSPWWGKAKTFRYRHEYNG